MARANRYEIDMCSGKLLPKILTFALPLMCSSVLQLLFNAADIVVVGKFAGDNSLAAVGSNAALINLMVNLFVGLSVGANILAARYTGAGNREGLRQTVHTSMLLAFLSGILLAVVGVIGLQQLADATRMWDDDFSMVLERKLGEEPARDLFARYATAYPDSYKDGHTPYEAVQDLAKLELLEEPGQLEMHLYRKRHLTRTGAAEPARPALTAVR